MVSLTLQRASNQAGCGNVSRLTHGKDLWLATGRRLGKKETMLPFQWVDRMGIDGFTRWYDIRQIVSNYYY
jgi:hypothetical protein